MAKARRRTDAPGPAYPPGWFVQDMLLHNWPPGWRPSSFGDDISRAARLRTAATQGRIESQERGVGWGKGTLTWLNGAHRA